MNKRNFFNKRDLVVIIVIFVLAFCLFHAYSLFNKGEAEYVQILYDGQVIKELSLFKDTEYIPDINKKIIIEIKDKKVHFKHSDCPDKICVNTGWLSKTGQTAVCLPNKLSVVVKTDEKKDNTIDTAI